MNIESNIYYNYWTIFGNYKKNINLLLKFSNQYNLFIFQTYYHGHIILNTLIFMNNSIQLVQIFRKSIC